MTDDAPRIFEAMDDGHPYFFRLDRVEDGDGGRVYIGVTRTGGIKKGTDVSVTITETKWRHAGWRPLRPGKHVPGWH